MSPAAPRAVVITAVHGRHAHLRRMRTWLATSDQPPLRHVIVAMDDHEIRDLVAAEAQVAAGALPTEVVEVDLSTGRLPLAAARNLGAAHARAALADTRAVPEGPEDLLIFLDVDCIPSPGLIGHYLRASARRPQDLLCGPVSYLPALQAQQLDSASAAELAQWAEPHPARPAPEPGEVLPHGEHALFWSLSFAVRLPVWDRIGGFDETYAGYGAEDTDFAWTARGAGIGLSWVGGARAHHQHHPVSRPPVEHLRDILRNGRIFAEKWGHWPMEGWLQEFESLGLVRREGNDWIRVESSAERNR